MEVSVVQYSGVVTKYPIGLFYSLDSTGSTTTLFVACLSSTGPDLIG